MCESCVEKSAHKVGAGTPVSPDRWFTYDVVAVDPGTHARAGVLHTPHGDVPTPIFMPVGTKATVKGILPDTLERLGTKILLNNTYHLSQRPGADLVEEMGGVHEFMQWHGPSLTASGGVQGGMHLDLRLRSLRHLEDAGDFPGYGIGGYSVGEDHDTMFESLEPLCAEYMPKGKPRYLMGVGNPTTLVRGVACGVDMFDCVLPTRTDAPLADHVRMQTAAGTGLARNARLVAALQNNVYLVGSTIEGAWRPTGGVAARTTEGTYHESRLKVRRAQDGRGPVA